MIIAEKNILTKAGKAALSVGIMAYHAKMADIRYGGMYMAVLGCSKI